MKPTNTEEVIFHQSGRLWFAHRAGDLRGTRHSTRRPIAHGYTKGEALYALRAEEAKPQPKHSPNMRGLKKRRAASKS